MTYKEKTLMTGVDLIERIALVLSKRPNKHELCSSLLSELCTETDASQAVFWRRDLHAATFHPEFATFDIDKSQHFDPVSFQFWGSWENGAASAYLLGEPSNGDQFPSGTPWTIFNWLLPLQGHDGSPQGIISLHRSEEFGTTNFSNRFLQVLSNALIFERKDQESAQQIANELWFERNMRLILARIHARLDRDHMLQSAVDTLGAILKVSSCLVVRIEGSGTRSTHEYVDPDLSPLGLGGGSTNIPQVVAAQMSERATVLEESGIRKYAQEQYGSGLDSLFESSMRSLAGTPILLHSGSFGALVIQSNKVRKWQRHELQLLENTANAISMALRNAELYQEAKEQVFNLNLLTNLTRQLSQTVEHLGKLPRVEAQEEQSLATAQSKIPLSGRELEVLRLIASGLANREIAQRLFLTESTVELHASRIRKKLKLKSRTALVKFACDNHLV